MTAQTLKPASRPTRKFAGCAAAVAGQGMAAEFGSFAQFWPFYLREHSKPATRGLHFAGTTLVVLLLGAALATASWWLLILIPLAGYGFAWAAHFAVERNRPATFRHPWWSLAADFRMWWLWLTGRLGTELARAGVAGRRS
jgi:hypothetical protein